MIPRHPLALSSLVTALAGLTFLCACEKPVVGAMGAPLNVEGVEFKVDGYSVEQLELDDGGETIVYDKPVLAIPVTITNTGTTPIPYNPSHVGQQMNEGTTPLLYLDPGAQAPLPPATKTAIKGIVLTRGTLPGQITQLQTIAPGDSVSDLYLFEVPPKTTDSLIFSLPPAWHGGEMPVLVRIPYAPKAPKGPKVLALGESHQMGPIDLTVKSATLAYIKIKDTAQGDGYSTNPLLRIDYTLKNTGDTPVTYDPSHRATGDVIVARLISPEEGSQKRAQFGATAFPEGQVASVTTLAPGDTLSDYLLFAPPSQNVSTLTLEYPGSIFSQQGIARVRFDYDPTVPPMPEEMKKKVPKVPDSEKSP